MTYTLFTHRHSVLWDPFNPINVVQLFYPPFEFIFFRCLCLPILTEIDPIIDRGTGAKQFEILISFVFGGTKDDEMQKIKIKIGTENKRPFFKKH